MNFHQKLDPNLYVPHLWTLMVIMQSLWWDSDHIFWHNAIRDACPVLGSTIICSPCPQERGTFTYFRFIQPACWSIVATLETGSWPAALDVTVIPPLQQQTIIHVGAATTQLRICLGCEGKQKVHVHSIPRSLLECGHQVHPYRCWDLWRLVCRCHQYHQNNWSSTQVGQRMGFSPADVTSHLFQRLVVNLWKGNTSMWILFFIRKLTV